MLEVSDLVQPPHVLVDLLKRFSLLLLALVRCRASRPVPTKVMLPRALSSPLNGPSPGKLLKSP